jgi:hypothetical protein
MNDHSLGDPALQSLEARLASLPPRLAAGEQQQLLYHCALAAGEAAGQRASSRAMRGWIAATSILALVCLGLTYRTAWHPEPALVHLSRTDGRANFEQRRSTARFSDRDEDNRRQLSVATALDHVVDFNWPRQSPSALTTGVDAAIDSEHPMLTSRSQISPDSI